MGELSCNCSKTLEEMREPREMRVSEIDMCTFKILKDIISLVDDIKILIGIQETEGGLDKEVSPGNLKENVQLNHSMANMIKSDLQKIVETL